LTTIFQYFTGEESFQQSDRTLEEAARDKLKFLGGLTDARPTVILKPAPETPQRGPHRGGCNFRLVPSVETPFDPSGRQR
jgi:hypothetical protein